MSQSLRRFNIVALLLLASLASPVFTSSVLAAPAYAKNSAKQKITSLESNLPLPKIDAKAWVLLEVDSGWLVAGNNQSEPLPPASITKLMTNYVVFDLLKKEHVGLEDSVSISEHAWRAEGSRMFADVNSKLSLGHLLKSTIIQSGNDAAIALAEYTGGSELAFASLMNKAAQELGLVNSNFQNSTGLPAPEHYMSATDIAKLSAAIIGHYPQYFAWYSEKEYTHNGITQYNRNKLLWKDPTVDGLKTGHTEAAGFCLVGTALRRGRRWIAVVLGSSDAKTREQEVLSLLNYGFAAFASKSLLDEQGGVTQVNVHQGVVDAVRLQPAGPAMVVVPTGRENDIEVEYFLSPYYQAPVQVGQAMGLAQVSLDKQVIADIPLIAMSEIELGSWWKQSADTIKLRFQEFWNN